MKDPTLADVVRLVNNLRYIDQDGFRRQRALLSDRKRLVVSSEEDESLLIGLIAILDDLADFMADALGMNGVLQPEKDAPVIVEPAYKVGDRVEAIRFDEELACPPLRGTKGTVEAILPVEEGASDPVVRLIVRWDNGVVTPVVVPPDEIKVLVDGGSR